MQVIKSPLQLKSHFFPSFSFEAKPGVAPPRESIRPDGGDLSISTAARFDKGVWQLSLDISTRPVEGKECPVSFRVVACGVFSADEQRTPEETERLVRVNGFSLLYSAARDFVKAFSGRGPYPGVTLPTVTFRWDPSTDKPVHPKRIESNSEESLNRAPSSDN